MLPPRARRGRRRESRCLRSRRPRRRRPRPASRPKWPGRRGRSSRGQAGEGPGRRQRRGRHPRRVRDRAGGRDPIARSVEPVGLGPLDPRDEAEGKRDRHRIVSGLGLERTRGAPTDVRVAESSRRQPPRRWRRRRPRAGWPQPREVEEELRGAPVRIAVTTIPTVLSSAAETTTVRRPPPRGRRAAPRTGSARVRRFRPSARAPRRRTRSPPAVRSEKHPSARNATRTGTPARAAKIAAKTLAQSTAPTTSSTRPSSMILAACRQPRRKTRVRAPAWRARRQATPARPATPPWSALCRRGRGGTLAIRAGPS